MLAKKMLITGGGGILGANLTRYYLQQGYRISLIVEDTPELWRLQEIAHLVTIYTVNVLDNAALRNTFQKVRPHVVIHCAGYGRFPYQKDKEKIYSINFQGTINVVNAAKEVGFECFINTGSWLEYGIHEFPVTEKTLLMPNTNYGVSKAAATQFCLKEALSHDLPIYTIRPFFMYGNYDMHAHLITSLLLGIIYKEKVCVSSPKQKYDFIHIEDVVDLYATVERMRPHNQFIFNAATGVDTSVESVVELIQREYGLVDYCWGKQLDIKQSALLHCPVSIDFTKQKLGWEPNYTLQQGLDFHKKWLEKHRFLYDQFQKTQNYNTVSML